MKPNLLKQSQTTMVLEKTEVAKQTEIKQDMPKQMQTQPVQANQTFVKPSKEKQERQEKQVFQENKASLFNAFNADNFATREKKKYITEQNQQLQKVETEIEGSNLPSYDFETQGEALVTFKSKAKPRKKQSNFRFKLVTIVYVLVLGVMTGWITASAVRLANVQNSLHLSDIKYAQKLKDLEKLQEKEVDNENSNLIPWQEIISVQPLPLEDITEYEQQSNWFDNIINWFGNLFGG
jgi:hypothetical protein